MLRDKNHTLCTKFNTIHCINKNNMKVLSFVFALHIRNLYLTSPTFIPWAEWNCARQKLFWSLRVHLLTFVSAVAQDNLNNRIKFVKSFWIWQVAAKYWFYSARMACLRLSRTPKIIHSTKKCVKSSAVYCD